MRRLKLDILGVQRTIDATWLVHGHDSAVFSKLIINYSTVLRVPPVFTSIFTFFQDSLCHKKVVGKNSSPEIFRTPIYLRRFSVISGAVIWNPETSAINHTETIQGLAYRHELFRINECVAWGRVIVTWNEQFQRRRDFWRSYPMNTRTQQLRFPSSYSVVMVIATIYRTWNLKIYRDNRLSFTGAAVASGTYASFGLGYFSVLCGYCETTAHSVDVCYLCPPMSSRHHTKPVEIPLTRVIMFNHWRSMPTVLQKMLGLKNGYCDQLSSTFPIVNFISRSWNSDPPPSATTSVFFIIPQQCWLFHFLFIILKRGTFVLVQTPKFTLLSRELSVFPTASDSYTPFNTFWLGRF